MNLPSSNPILVNLSPSNHTLFPHAYLVGEQEGCHPHLYAPVLPSHHSCRPLKEHSHWAESGPRRGLVENYDSEDEGTNASHRHTYSQVGELNWPTLFKLNPHTIYLNQGVDESGTTTPPTTLA